MSAVPADPLVARRCLRDARTHLPPGLALGQKITGGGAVELSALGALVTLSDGRVVLDFGSYAVTLLGHAHPAVVAAVRAQLDLMATSTRVLANPATTTLAARLVALLQPSRLRRVWLGSDGSDAVEAALKLARLASRRPRVLAVEGAYHGKTLGALAATWSPRYRAGLEAVLPAVTHLAADDPAAVAAEVARGDVAALVFEPLQGESGVRALRPDVLRRWSADARAAGAFVIADEVQTGLWRAGEPSLALSPAYGVDVDAVLLGKPLGGGVLPLSAAVCSEELYAPLVGDPFVHTTTFSGHPLACAAALAGLDALEGLAERGHEVAGRLDGHLDRLAAAHPDVVTQVRGRGLLRGLELAGSRTAGTVLTELSESGLLTSPCLGRPEVLRLLPPAVATDEQVDTAARLLDEALHAAGTAARADAASATRHRASPPTDATPMLPRQRKDS